MLLWIENIVIRHLKVGASISLLNGNKRYKAREKEKYTRNGKLEAKLLNLGKKEKLINIKYRSIRRGGGLVILVIINCCDGSHENLNKII